MPVHVTDLSMNILSAGNKSPMQRVFSKNSMSNLLPALRFLGRRYKFHNFVIFPLMQVMIIFRRGTCLTDSEII